MSVATVSTAPLTNILSGATRQALNALQQLTKTGPALPKGNILDDIVNFFKNLGTKQIPGKISPGPTITPNIPTKFSSISRNVAITGATTLGTVGLLTLTPTGQQITQTGASTIDFLKQNPIIPVGIIIIAGLVLIGGKKS